jgi:hypothetical protein
MGFTCTSPPQVRAKRQRIAKLDRRGVVPSLIAERTTVAELLDVVGDLTLCEIHRLVEVSTEDHNRATGLRDLVEQDPLVTRANATRSRRLRFDR